MFANASISTKFDENGNAFVRLNIDEGKKVKLNDVIFLSDQKISEEDKNQLLKVLKLKKGDVIYFDKLQESIEKLNEYLKIMDILNPLLFYKTSNKWIITLPTYIYS